jgi:predicted RNase H-like HicB family nuclease
MSVKIKDVKAKVIREDDGTYSIACSALGVYSTGKNLQDAKKNYLKAIKLHLSVLKDKAKNLLRFEEAFTNTWKRTNQNSL